VADPRNPPVPFSPGIETFGASQFDDSIFEKVALPPEEDAADVDDDLDGDEPPPQREGLPPGFRMRHDAHYVEDLLARNRAGRIEAPAAAEAHVPGNGHAAPAAATVLPLSKACAEIGQSLDAIAACLRLLPATPRPTAERIALDLIGAEAARATWLVQALALLDDEPPVAHVAVDLQSVVNQVASALATGWERQGSRLDVEADAAAPGARGDRPLLTVAVAGMVMALQAVTDGVPGALITVSLRQDGDRAVVEVAEESVSVPASWRARFFDPAWTDRPGGRRAAIALAAARRVATLHRGALTLSASEHGGCRLLLSVPRA